MTPAEMEKTLLTFDRVPTLPAIYGKLVTALDSPDTTIQAVGDLIAEDPVIASRVLKHVNSAFFGFPQRVGNLQRAIVVLGFNPIRNLVLATSVMDAFKGFRGSARLDMTQFWQHSVACAVASRAVASAARLKNPDEIFTAGLLHDVGKLAAAVALPEQYAASLDEAAARGERLTLSERRLMGMDHARLGAALARRWRLPSETVQMVEHHHADDHPASVPAGVAAVHLGNILAMALGLGEAGEPRLEPVHPAAWLALGLQVENVEFIMERTIKLLAEHAAIMDA